MKSRESCTKASATTRLAVIATLAVSILLIGACSAPGERRTITLASQNDSGVTGTVVLTDVGRRQTEVTVQVEPVGNLDMPAHIHPGTCVDLVPQVRYPLRSVINGASTTVVPSSLADLMAGNLAVNLHRSNDDMGTYMACADLR